MLQGRIDRKILNALSKFNVDLRGKTVLTEGASGNYACTCVSAALAGADVYAYTRNSRFGSIEEVKSQVNKLASHLNVSNKIKIIDNLNDIDLSIPDIVTNTGFLRPLNAAFISKLKSGCVIPLMWEPWEYRESELDLEACRAKEIPVYGTNESDTRLRTMEYIGYVVLKLLLNQGCSPFSGKILVLGCKKFVAPTMNVLLKSGYAADAKSNYTEKLVNLSDYEAIILMEHENNIPLIGGTDSYINILDSSLRPLIVHICGKINEDVSKILEILPEKPAAFGYMSYPTDYVDAQAVVDLHTAGLLVAEGMLKAGKRDLKGLERKNFMEQNYPALAFDQAEYW